MSRQTIRTFVVLLGIGLAGVIGCAAHRAQAGEHCFYKGTMFSDGAAVCQTGMLYRCDEGDWRSLGSTCKDSSVALSRTCQFGGISYSTGAASCQAGNQFRCEDGIWQSLGVACAVGDSPIRVLPSGRTCMFGEATVANNSTICKSGTTFLCSDGEWINLGTLCR
jgi:hypothetical protein